MIFAFDLWSYDDVKANAAEVLPGSKDESMPCDEPWGEEKIEKLRVWIDAGCQP